MSSAQEYRQFAEECVDWAKKATTDAERETFLKMAEDWLRAAAIAAQRDAPASTFSDSIPPVA
jgi:ribosomal protein L17